MVFLGLCAANRSSRRARALPHAIICWIHSGGELTLARTKGAGRLPAAREQQLAAQGVPDLGRLGLLRPPSLGCYEVEICSRRITAT